MMNIIRNLAQPHYIGQRQQIIKKTKELIVENRRQMTTTTTTTEKPIRRVFVTKPIPDEAVAILKANNIELNINESVPLSREKLLAGVRNIDGLYCTLNEKIDQEVIDAAGPGLKVIGTCSVGFDHVDYRLCKQRNIPIGYTPGVLTDATAEFTVGLILNTCRRISESTVAAKNGEWTEWILLWMCGKGLKGSTLGVFGLGRIGLSVIHRLENFGLGRVIYHNRKQNPEADKLIKQVKCEYVDVETLLSESDILLVTCSSNKETERFFDLTKFKRMKRDSIFINVSRGNVVNQEDLVYALKNNIIGAAGLDVTMPEPLPSDHELFKLANCVVTPHIASAETSTRVKMATITSVNIVNGLDNKPLLHQINV